VRERPATERLRVNVGRVGVAEVDWGELMQAYTQHPQCAAARQGVVRAAAKEEEVGEGQRNANSSWRWRRLTVRWGCRRRHLESEANETTAQ
jgi:hypothetical protein